MRTEFGQAASPSRLGCATRIARRKRRASIARWCFSEKKRAPCSGALSRYGVVSPRLIAAACPASWPASGFPEENFCRYFFFFLPAFFFILVFNLGLDFLAELFFLTGIDTSLTVAAAGQAPETPGTSDEPLLISPSGPDYRNPLFKNQEESGSFIKKF